MENAGFSSLIIARGGTVSIVPLIVLVGVLLLATVLIGVFLFRKGGGIRIVSTVVIMGIGIVFMVVFFSGFFLAKSNTSITVAHDQLQIKSFIYGKTVPLSDIIGNEIAKVNLQENADYSIVLRTNGTSMPGFKSGWMKLKNGKKALVYITDQTNVALIPTTEDYVIMFSMNDVDALKEAVMRSGS
jgi:hypothetical protein